MSLAQMKKDPPTLLSSKVVLEVVLRVSPFQNICFTEES